MKPVVAIIMGSKSDLPTMEKAKEVLDNFEIPYEVKVISAHRTPNQMFAYADEIPQRGIKIVIAGAGGAAHVAGMIAAKTIIPVLGVPIRSKELDGLDSLLSIVQMPGGIPVGTLAIGEAGAKNAALLACRILAITDESIQRKLLEYQRSMQEQVLSINI
ncbi:MAG: 5-(carboxyamino)imidazole ribonucleotide mutase [Candidatus Izemoplasmatales bacterium]|nr:5-(carboxyamino)imidazole ribonucleotide mutase [Candidatus Izemoplasmatales bacterium]MDD3865097.1 5-(carboxyamino)imidazole ribonucleotide mutase [Candidatus Izemoplasmatales bacterium]